MVAAEVRELSRMPGLQIGAHTVNHLALPDQPGQVQRAELSECRSVLASVTGRTINLFAYPYGAVDRQVASAARRTFGWSVSCETRPVGESFDAARVPRIEVKGLDARTFAGAIDRFFSAVDRDTPITRVPE
jgi:peptidoglycan/xylan/chitin deacetylase (PgdA/CDA1 family)